MKRKKLYRNPPPKAGGAADSPSYVAPMGVEDYEAAVSRPVLRSEAPAAPAAPGGAGGLAPPRPVVPGTQPPRGGGAGGRAGSNKPTVTMKEATKAFDAAMKRRQQELEKAAKAETDPAKKAEIEKQIAAVKDARKNPPMNLTGLEGELKKHGVEDKMIPQELADGKDDRGKGAREDRALDQKDQEIGLQRDKMKLEERSLDQAERKNDTEKYQGWTRMGIEGFNALKGVSDTVLKEISEAKNRVMQTVLKMTEIKAQESMKDKEIRAQRVAARNKEGADALAKARDNIGKEAQPGSNRANLLKSSTAGTHGTQDEKSMFSKNGDGVGPDGKQKLDKRSQDNEMTVRRLAGERQREDAERRSAKAPPTGYA